LTDWNLDEAAAYWMEQPGDQQALISLMLEAQEHAGGALTEQLMEQIADRCGVKTSMLTALIRRIPSLRLKEGPHELEICMNPRGCAAGGGKALADWLAKTYGAKENAVSLRGNFRLLSRPCLKRCGRGPSIRWDGTTYEHADRALLEKLIGE